MKKEIIVAITTTLLAVSAYSQSYEKWNDFYKRTEYFDENGRMTGFSKYNISY